MHTLSLRWQKGFALIALFMFSFSFTSFVGAQERPTAPPKESTATKVVVVATINVQDIKLLSQDNNTFTIRFNISNGEGAQPKVIYAVDLLQKDAAGDFSLVDQKIYDNDILSLGVNETVVKNITYTAPAYLKGKYAIQVEAKNPDGLLFGMVQADDEVTLGGTGEYIQIDQSSCFLTVDNEASNKHYTLGQGVDITKDETLSAHCSVTSTFKTDQTVIPTFETRYRTTFGKLISTDKQVPIVLKAGQKTDFTTKLPKTTEPQAYDAILTFLAEGNQKISSSVAFHYVLRGESATIQNLTLDKDYYAKGDIAKVMFFWSGSADSFPGSRLGTATPKKEGIAIFSITDKENNTCTAPYSKKLGAKNQGGVENIEISISSNCENPIIKASIVNSDKKVLASNSYEIVSKTKPDPVKTMDPLTAILYVLGFVVVILLVAYFPKKNRNTGVKVLMVGLMIFGGVIGGGKEARADTFAGGEANGMVVYTVSIDKSEYTPGELIKATGYGSFWGCSNLSTLIEMGVWNRSSWVELVNEEVWGIEESGSEPVYLESKSTSGSTSFGAPMTPGSYYVQFYGQRWQAYHEFLHNIYYKVKNPAKPGVCGSASGHVFSSTDTAYVSTNPAHIYSYPQCENGTPTVTTFPSQGGSVSWKCSGTAGGASSGSCSASRALPACTGTAPSTLTHTETHPGDSTVTVDTPFTYSPTDTSVQCEYKCSSGYVRDVTTNTCVIPSCQGALPENTALYGIDEASPANNITQYTYSSTDNPSIKCEYGCDSNSVRNAGNTACIIPVCLGTAPSVSDHTELYSGDDAGIPKVLPFPRYEYSSTNTSRKCEYKCDNTSVRDITTNTCVVPTCQGTLPANTAIYTGDNSGLVNNTTYYSYSSSNTSTKCEYGCNSTSMRNAKNTACIIPICRGTIPSHAELYPGDDVGIPKVLPFPLYSYSASDSSAKCEYKCSTNYVWDGSSCIFNGSCGTANGKTYSINISPESFSPDTLCISPGIPTPNPVPFPQKGETVNWKCGVNPCFANRQQNATCGYKKNIPSFIPPTAVNDSLCADSSKPEVTNNLTTNKWEWTCLGLFGGADVECTAPKSAFKFWEF